MYCTVQQVTSPHKEKTRQTGSEERLSRVMASHIFVKKNETKQLLVKKDKMKKK